jgi:plastocyanin
MRKFLLLVSLIVFSAAARLGAEDLTLPAAASIVGGAPFFSDVRAFNTSYTDALDVTARYRCFLTCTAVGAAEIQFTLNPRESRAFNDIVQNTFLAPNTAGGVEFEHSGSGDQLVVTSRLYSTEPEPTVGMFIPGLPNSDAHTTTVLTSIRNGATAGGSFRTNVGVFNREDSAVDITFRIFDAGAQVGNSVTINVAAHAGAQVNRIFLAAGQDGHATENAVIVVAASHEVFSYAAVIDNNTTDPIFVVGAEDQPFQETTPTGPTQTPTAPAATVTPTVPGPTVTPTPPVGGTRTVNVGGAGTNFIDQVSGNSTSTITVGTTVNWVWVGGFHNVSSGACPPCTPAGQFRSGDPEAGGNFSFTFTTAGTFPYYCEVHDQAMTGTVIVN